MTRNLELKRKCRALKTERSRLQADTNQPELREVTSELMLTTRTVTCKHVDEHPAVKHLIAARPKRVESLLRDLPSATTSVDRGAHQSTDNELSAPDLTSSVTASSSSGPCTIQSALPVEDQTQTTDIIGPSSRYQRGAYQVEMPGSVRDAEATLRRRSADHDIGEHYFIHMSRDDVIREGIRNHGEASSDESRRNSIFDEERRRSFLDDVATDNED